MNGNLGGDWVDLIPGIGDTNRANRERWCQLERQRLLRLHPALAAAVAAPLHHLRCFLGPPPVARREEDEFWLGRDGRVWYQPIHHAEEDPPLAPRRVQVLLSSGEGGGAAPAVVTAVRGNDAVVVLALEGGAVLRFSDCHVPEEGPIVLQGPVAHRLPGERVVQIEILWMTAYALTAAGRLWVLPHEVDAHHMTPGLPPHTLGAPTPACQPVGQVGAAAAGAAQTGLPPPAVRFVRFDVASGFDNVMVTSLCAVDAEGLLHAAGPPFGDLLERLPPTPALVRSVLACARPGAPLALLVDGTVWSLAGQHRLPLLRGVTAMRRPMPLPAGNWEAVRFEGPRRPRLDVDPRRLYEIRDWMEGGGGGGRAAGLGESYGAAMARRRSASGRIHYAEISADGSLQVRGFGHGSLRPEHGCPWNVQEDWERMESSPADLSGESAAELWAGAWWTVVRTVQGSLWVWGATIGVGVLPGVAACRQVHRPTRVSRLADGTPAPAFTAAAAGCVGGVLCLCAQDADGLLYAAGRHSASLSERLLVPAAGEPPRCPVRQLLAVPEPLALFEDGRLWSFSARRLLARTDVVSLLQVWSVSGSQLVEFRQREGRDLRACPHELFAATW